MELGLPGRGGVYRRLLVSRRGVFVEHERALSSGAEGGATEPRVLGASANPFAPYRLPLLAGAVIAFGLFIWSDRRPGLSLIPLSLFRSRVFSAAHVANLLAKTGIPNRATLQARRIRTDGALSG